MAASEIQNILLYWPLISQYLVSRARARRCRSTGEFDSVGTTHNERAVVSAVGAIALARLVGLGVM